MGMRMVALRFVLLLAWMLMAVDVVSGGGGGGGGVTYDGRALIINGTRRMLFSGSIHYPRSTPQMWPSLIAEAKAGGLDVIQTYVFWNVHEPVQGQYNFEGRYDLVKFIKLVHAQGLYVSLRIGPFIEAEWNYGGFPFWLHDVPGIDMRCHNGPFEFHMHKFVSMIVKKMKTNGLYASQGGPIIISQIENEYQNAEAACHERGPPYVKWAATMAVGLKTGVPWMMCKQRDAPDPVINTCNGLNCAKTFEGPNSPTKPAMWTENWTFSFQVYGKETRTRSAEDLAFATTLFIAKTKGSFVNYYMYHGGTNFGRSSSSYAITSYYDPAPLDEYGLIWLPTWGHLRELHAAVKSSSQALLFGTYSNQTLGEFQEAHVYQDDGHCSAFLVNYDAHNSVRMLFTNTTYQLPPKSISILPDCKTVAFNTAEVNAQTGTRRATPVQFLNQHRQWGSYRENISNVQRASFQGPALLEQMNTTKDVTDYLWYTIRYNNTQECAQQTLHVESTAHIFHVYVNDQLLGIMHGSHESPPPPFDKPVSFKAGENSISLLSGMVGLPDSGARLQIRTAGIRNVNIRGPGNSVQDLTKQTWSYQVGLNGENMKIHTKEGSNKAEWGCIDGSTNKTLIWYKTTFDRPAGTGPLALNFSSMSKGEVWINGHSIGRYWASFKNPSGQSTQTMYHVPRALLVPEGNLLVIFEEIGGDPTGITLDTIAVSRVCSNVAETYHPPLFSEEELPAVQLQCQQGKTISSIEFASYGNPLGGCRSYARGSCHSDASIAVAEEACLGKNSCSIPVSNTRLGGDPCHGTKKSLIVVANCS